MALIRIKDLLIRTIIGFNPDERKNRQDVLINIEIEVDTQKAIETDESEGIYDYKAITKQVISLVQESEFNLLERLTHEILSLIMKDERVMRARVEVDKPHALRFAESVSVVMEDER
ncbi:dihydroneopterin triphosphate 2'-epimerase [Prolixibacter bellariivorans]|jgi:D-erythro-7,8-dihydroneopterin triphosphate epimerase|uniref:Dihydroneopterin triphosphate 2'-epimerase n=1 Tax=Prolixibacter bellariivorans TaxID=314319 RepID=A0A5M4AYL4_9BACT|nr:dihydroneopterin aldolase [Prolixibacter bellariivorans]GET32778.1 dihydroneopterin triphosphate 2'-epimerase [Prolixibacter bellariivorans]